MMHQKLTFLLILSFCFLLNPPVSLSEEEKENTSKEIYVEKTLEEVLEEEKSNKYQKLDDFLKDFDKGFSKNMGEKFEDLLKEDEFVDEDEEISIDDFDSFNEQFDKMIEEDLADFELFELDMDALDVGLNLKSPMVGAEVEKRQSEIR